MEISIKISLGISKSYPIYPWISMKHPCYETWSETVRIWQADEPLFYNGVELADEDATLLEYNIAGSRVSNGKWCNMGFLKYGNIGNPKSWHLVILVVISLGFPNGFLVVVVKPMGKTRKFEKHRLVADCWCSPEVPDDCPGGPVIHLGGAPWKSFDLEPVPQCPSGPVPGIFDSWVNDTEYTEMIKEYTVYI